MQFGAQAHEVEGVPLVASFTRDAGVDRLAQAALLHQTVDRQKLGAPLDCPSDAVKNDISSAGLEDVVGRRQLGRADDLLIAALGRDHEEDRRQRHHVVMPQILEQLLPVLAFAEIVLAQDDVVFPASNRPHRRASADRVLDLADATLVEHVVHAGAHARMGLDQEYGQVGETLHDDKGKRLRRGTTMLAERLYYGNEMEKMRF